ncbi:SH3 domain-containing protein [Qiania dongpingensis]|uniref:Amidase n=1 Tax=Qiania dongpingensis TaxID=2763669 RepID=A0A7G9G5G3_9FIRM|nr:SH3 domain-containing protein [Qiania dongpingensis]QNM06045.1 amidase [Qiania dongpingensis]
MSNVTNSYCVRNDCYIEGTRLEGVKYLIVHSPSVYPAVIRAVNGSNNWFKRWNKPGVEKLVHGFIDDTGVYNFAPYSLACWQIGTTWGNRNCIGYELCELDSAAEFQKVWKNAVNHYAELCRTYGLTPDKIVGHYEAHEKGFASDHDDPAPYFRRFGKTMDDFRSDVQKKLSGGEDSDPVSGDVTVVKTYEPWAHGQVTNLKAGDTLNVRTGPGAEYPKLAAWPELAEGNEVDVLDKYSNGWVKINIQGAKGYVNSYYLLITERQSSNGQNGYTVWVGKASGLGSSRLNVRTGPGTSYGLLEAWPKLGEGNEVEVTGENGGWYQIRIENKYTGWVSKDYIKKA